MRTALTDYMENAFADYLKDAQRKSHEEGHAQGHAEGHAEGREEAWKESRRHFALSMLAEGFAHELTAKLSELPLAEVQALAKENGR